MNLEDLKRVVDFAYDNANNYGERSAEQITVTIKVFRVGVAGGTPKVGVKHISAGFDWDANTLIIVPEGDDLREINRDEIKTLIKNHEELGWKQYQIDKIKRENEKLKRVNSELHLKIEQLEAPK